MQELIPFTFTSSKERFDPDALIASVPANAANKEELLNALAHELRFPDYFGHNWDALDECLRDFSWLEERRIVLLHEVLPSRLIENDLRKYIEILARCARDWKLTEEHELVVVFPDEARESIEKILKAVS